MAAKPSGKARACKAPIAGSNPAAASNLLGNVEEIWAYFLAMTCIVGQKPLPMTPAIALKASSPWIRIVLFQPPNS